MPEIGRPSDPVAGVEETTTISLDQQRVRIEGAAVVQERCDPEAAELERLSMTEEPCWGARQSGDPEGCLLKDLMGGLSHEERPRSAPSGRPSPSGLGGRA